MVLRRHMPASMRPQNGKQDGFAPSACDHTKLRHSSLSPLPCFRLPSSPTGRPLLKPPQSQHMKRSSPARVLNAELLDRSSGRQSALSSAFSSCRTFSGFVRRLAVVSSFLCLALASPSSHCPRHFTDWPSRVRHLLAPASRTTRPRPPAARIRLPSSIRPRALSDLS